MAGGRVHTSHSTPMDPPLAISYRNHQKSLQPLGTISFVLFLLKGRVKKGGGGKAWHDALLNTLLVVTWCGFFKADRWIVLGVRNPKEV